MFPIDGISSSLLIFKENFEILRFIFRYSTCSSVKAPGLAADMHFRDDVIAFIGPACTFALEPVAGLAAYWNTPIVTGMGDQVCHFQNIYANEKNYIYEDRAEIFEKIVSKKKNKINERNFVIL